MPGALQYHFNNQWQDEVSGLLFGSEHAVQEVFSYQKIADLTISFVKQAEHFAKTIVMERFSATKTIRPISSMGVLGGLKYCVNGIFFKLAEDPLGIGAENACKVAGLELKSVTAIMNAAQNLKLELHVPLCAVIDYLGCRLIAMAMAPLDGDATLVSGSQDAGVNIKSDPRADELLGKVAAHLNLAPHRVAGKTVALAVDAELHLGLDGRFYLIDLSRAMPPETPRKDLGLRHAHLFRVLRPELVRRNPVPLNADAFSGFVAREADKGQEACVGATKRLFSFAVPWAALLVDQLFTSRREAVLFFTLESLHRIRNLVHSVGVNLRYLCNVLKRSRQVVSQQLLLIEMVARTLKAILRKVLCKFNAGEPFSRSLEKSVIGVLNLFFQLDHAFWEVLAATQQSYFGNLDLQALTGSQLMDEALHVPFFFTLVFERVNESLGLVWSKRAIALVEGCDPIVSVTNIGKGGHRRNSTATQKKVSLRHIGKGGSDTTIGQAVPPSAQVVRKMLFVEDLAIGIRTKTTSISALAAGLHWIRTSEGVSNPEDASYFRELARNSLEKALQNNPTNPVTTRELAKILWQNVADAKGEACLEEEEQPSVVERQSRRSIAGGKWEGDDARTNAASSLRPFWFESTLRYADSLFCVSLQNASGEILADTQSDYARFLLAGGGNAFKAVLLLAGACQTRRREKDVSLLARVLMQVGLEHEANLLC